MCPFPAYLHPSIRHAATQGFPSPNLKKGISSPSSYHQHGLDGVSPCTPLPSSKPPADASPTYTRTPTFASTYTYIHPYPHPSTHQPPSNYPLSTIPLYPSPSPRHARRRPSYPNADAISRSPLPLSPVNHPQRMNKNRHSAFPHDYHPSVLAALPFYRNR
ncbi:hypothetical protein DM02DRAFT_105706 [Periconia macrospinosa]|uniref:Uncharacterized protein n=1 Tax=Periconia macrospinosa TaxID=97972 RepID=A0A2V1DGG4_9PLEO|nr:hypothetical protein DM02DRAFT_105706 [Periconia macrospinosa]